MKKKLLSLVLTGCLAAGLLTGCGSAGDNAKTASKSKDSYKVGICQLVQHPALDAATQGFKAALTEKLGDKVTFDEQNASGDSATCATIVKSVCFLRCGFDSGKCNSTSSGCCSSNQQYSDSGNMPLQITQRLLQMDNLDRN